MIRTYTENGFLHLVIENEKIRAVFLPAIGGKMKELINLETGTQFLLENQREDKVYSRALYGSDFSKYDVSGYDECFPTVSAYEKDLKEDKNHCFPDAIFAVNDPVVIAAFQRIKEAGLKIPEDIGIVGFSNNKITSLVDPNITTVDQPSFEMGKKAAEILIELIESEKKNARAKTIILDAKLIVRGST